MDPITVLGGRRVVMVGRGEGLKMEGGGVMEDGPLWRWG